MWEYHGLKRPPFADKPGPGQESVWDYPRPPALVVDERRIEVCSGELVIADSRHNYRILETASPPTFYISPSNVCTQLLELRPGMSVCEWKGVAQYWALRNPHGSPQSIGWSYRRPNPPFAAIAGYFSFYPALVECFVDGERVRPQPGEFYGGWVTSEIVGPFKGNPGSQHW